MLGSIDAPSVARTRSPLRAVAAPRGIAKTTVGKARLAHALIFGLDRCCMIISAEQKLAARISASIRLWFVEDGSEVARLFAPRGTPPRGVKGPFWVRGGKLSWTIQSSVWGHAPGRVCGVIAASFGSQVRGANIEGHRPTRIVIDDAERPNRVGNPEQRRQGQQFLEDDILKAGPVEGGLAVEWLGTVLHPDAILARLLKHPGWSGRKFQAVIRWPSATDLWAACGRVWSDLTLGGPEARVDAARAFYEANREAMDAGAEVLDPVALPIFDVYLQVWSQGMRSVLRELQNEPRDPAAALFDSTAFQTCRVVQTNEGEAVVAADGRRVRLADCQVRMRWDPSLGESDGDYSAIAVIAFDRFGYGFLLQVWMARAKTGAQLDALWALAERWQCRRASLESNGFQALLANDFARQQRERRAANRYWQLEVRQDPSTTDKNERIASLDVPLSAGWLQVNLALVSAEVLQQFDDFPGGDHDDGPDAVEGCWARRPGQGPRMVEEKGR